MFEHLDFLPGKIIFNGYDISSDEPIDEDNDSLAEDMFQVVYPDNKLRVYAVRSAAEPPHKVKLNLTLSALFMLFGFLSLLFRFSLGIVRGV